MYSFYSENKMEGKEEDSYCQKLKKQLNRSVSAKQVFQELNAMRGLNRKEREYI